MYKRIIRIKTEETAALLAHNVGDTHIRPAHGGIIGEYAIEVPETAPWRRHADRLADKYDCEG